MKSVSSWACLGMHFLGEAAGRPCSHSGRWEGISQRLLSWLRLAQPWLEQPCPRLWLRCAGCAVPEEGVLGDSLLFVWKATCLGTAAAPQVHKLPHELLPRFLPGAAGEARELVEHSHSADGQSHKALCLLCSLTGELVTLWSVQFDLTTDCSGTCSLDAGARPVWGFAS